MDEAALFFLGMAGQAGLRLDVVRLDVRVLELFLGRYSDGGEKTKN
jgi:hypothetical protein